MVVVKLEGGLGNQLFQYAFGRAVSSHRRTPLKLDVSWFSSRWHPDIPRRYYELDRFDIVADRARALDVMHALGPFPAALNEMRKHAPQGLARRIPRYAIRTDAQPFRFDASVFADPLRYFDGFWQTPKYFDSMADTIRRELGLTRPPQASSVAEQIATTASTAIHFRRTDYVVFGLGVCDNDYYERAIALVRQRVADPKFFVFCDEVEWARQWVARHPGTTLVSDGSRSAPDELHLMAKCRHFVIANSTFSWWGAWLSTHANKIVIAPRRWDRARPDPNDVVPDDWLRM